MEKDQEIQKKIDVIVDAKKRSYSFAIVTLIVVLILVLGAIQPTVTTITRILSEIEAKKETSAQLQQKIDSLNTLSKTFTASSKDFSNLPFYFPNRGDFSLMMANINELSRQNNFELMNIGFDNADPNLALNSESLVVLQPWKAVVSVNGRRDSLIPFLKSLESLPNYPVVDAISFSNTTDELGNTVFSITLRIYKIDDQNFYKTVSTTKSNSTTGGN